MMEWIRTSSLVKFIYEKSGFADATNQPELILICLVFATKSTLTNFNIPTSSNILYCGANVWFAKIMLKSIKSKFCCFSVVVSE